MVSPWWNATSPGRDRRVLGRDAARLGPVLQVEAVRGEDVREGLHREAVRARHVAHAAGRAVRAVEGDPRGDGVGLGERPVRLVVVRVGRAPARLLVERLVVPQAQRRLAEQLRRGLPDPRVERERAHLREVLPQVDHLAERLLVLAALGERARVVRGARGHAAVDGGAEARDLVGSQEPADHDEAALVELLPLLFGRDAHDSVYCGHEEEDAEARRQEVHGSAQAGSPCQASCDPREPCPAGSDPGGARAPPSRDARDASFRSTMS